ncbi:hypothetical protein [Mycobacterium sp. E2733]|uniref:hypothetical protein n=1 Tax=Mycobacterium sp. E2733 TaxID=1834138 RepID=UPI0009EE0FCE|nr:hypothetical protein [Mycobacterium sp. E2733]
MGDVPPNFGGEPPIVPPPAQWQPAYPPQPLKRPRTWPAIALALIAVLLGAVALVVAATRSTNNSTQGSPTTSAAPAYNAAESAAAHKKLCDVYTVAARAVQIETNGDNPALSGIAVVNGAVMLEHVVAVNPAMPPGDRDTALALAEAYSNSQATAATVQQRDDPLWQSTISDVNNKDAAMKRVCGGG